MPLSGIGIGEMVVIAMLVLIVFGPKRLPEITRTLGGAIREFKKGMNEIQRELEMADREPRRRSAKPQGPSIAHPAVAGTAVAGETGETDDAGPEEAREVEGASGSGAAVESTATDETQPTDETPPADESKPADGSEPTAQLTRQEPPEVRADYIDPAEEFIDPWSTDSSKPSIPPPRPGPAPSSSEPMASSIDEGDGEGNAEAVQAEERQD